LEARLSSTPELDPLLNRINSEVQKLMRMHAARQLK
jgi:hypothetical protein